MIKLIKSCTLLGVSLVIAVAFAEGVFHLFPTLLPVSVRESFYDMGVADPDIGSLPAPNSSSTIVTHDFAVPYTVDSHGFRNQEPWPEKPDMVVLGDSLVFGYGVDQQRAWPQLLSGLTGKSVVNLGVVGASPQQYRAVYEKFGRKLQPSVVVVGFFARNDFWDTSMFREWQRSNVGGNFLEWRTFGKPNLHQMEDPIYRLRYGVRKNSYVLGLLKSGADTFRSSRRTIPSTVELGDGSKTVLFENDFRDKTEDATPCSDIFDAVVEVFSEMAAAAAEDDNRLVVVLQPAKEEVYSPNPEFPPQDAAAAIRARLERLDIEYIDAAPAFRRKAEAGDTLFFPTDGHPNASGYELLAELVAEYLADDADPHPGLEMSIK